VRLTDFHLLLLEDDPALLANMVRAARKARLGNHVQIVRDQKEAVDYLTRLEDKRVSGDGIRLPSLFLFNLEGESGLRVLKWLREQPKLRKMIKVGLFSPRDGVATDRAYELGVNSCLARPDSAEGLHDMFLSIRQYWVALNQPPQL
jgi:two-component system response regulator